MRALTLPLTALAVATLGLLSGGCPGGGDDGTSVEPDAGTIIIQFDAGPLPDPTDGGSPDAGPPNTVVFVTGLTPPNGPLAGGNRIILEGDNFDPECTVTIGTVDATQCLFLTTRSMSCAVPPGERAGPADVTATCTLGVGFFEGGYTYFSPVRLDTISPAVGSTEGGTDIVLVGEAFSEGMLALIGDRQVVGLTITADGTSATAKTPPGLRTGRTDVTVIDAFGRAVLGLGFTYTGALTLDSVSPVVVEAGQALELAGSGFADRAGIVTEAAVGAAAAARDNLISDRRLRVTVPGLAAGTHDVSVTQGDQSAVLRDAVVILPAAVGDLAVSAVVPSTVASSGGEPITVVGEGFVAGVTSVTVGGTAATNVVVVDDRTLRATAPAGTLGAADVTVTLADARTATLVAGASFVDRLSVTGVAPAAAGR